MLGLPRLPDDGPAPGGAEGVGRGDLAPPREPRRLLLDLDARLRLEAPLGGVARLEGPLAALLLPEVLQGDALLAPLLGFAGREDAADVLLLEVPVW